MDVLQYIHISMSLYKNNYVLLSLGIIFFPLQLYGLSYFFNQITELIEFGIGIILSYHLLLILLKFMTVYTFNDWDTCFN